MLTQLLANGVADGCVIALMALGLALIYNTTRILHIAHGATFTLTAYLCYWLLSALKWPIGWAVFTALAGSIVLGVLFELLLYQPLSRRNASPMVALLASLGLYSALINVIALMFGNDLQTLRPGIDITYSLAGIMLTRMQLLQVSTAVIILPAVLIWLARSTLGSLVRAVRDNPKLAESNGADLRRVRLLAFGLGSLLAGLAAVLRAFDIGVDPLVGMPELLLAIVALIVGGMGSFSGCVAGALLLSSLQSIVVWKLSSRWEDAVTFILLLIILVFWPRGLIAPYLRLEEQES